MPSPGSSPAILQGSVGTLNAAFPTSAFDMLAPFWQDWTKQESEDAEGVVTFRYREKPDEPPDVQTIQKQMAIVAWQPGPNRVVQVPSEVQEKNVIRSTFIHCFLQPNPEILQPMTNLSAIPPVHA